jgi:hypothetical protein
MRNNTSFPGMLAPGQRPGPDRVTRKVAPDPVLAAAADAKVSVKLTTYSTVARCRELCRERRLRIVRCQNVMASTELHAVGAKDDVMALVHFLRQQRLLTGPVETKLSKERK